MFAPLQVESWMYMTDEQKKPVFDRLEGDGSSRMNRIDLHKRTRYNSEKGWVDDSEATYDKMQEQLEEYKSMQVEIGDANQSMSEFDMAEKACDKVLRTCSGFIPGLRHGPKPQAISPSKAASIRVANAELRDKLVSTQAELECTQIALRRLEEAMDTERQAREADRQMLHETIAANLLMMQALQRMCPGILQPLDQPSSSLAPSHPPVFGLF